MKCRECGGSMTKARETVDYSASGLPVTLVNVEVRRCSDCGDWQLVLPRLEELHRVLAIAVINKPALLSPEEIRFLRKHMGWSGGDFARHMGTAPATVSRWENGKARMGPTADRLLRTMVAVYERSADYSLDALAAITPRKHTRPMKVGLRLVDSGWREEKRTGTNG